MKIRKYTTPEQAGLNSCSIDAFLRALESHDYRIHSLVIARRDGIAYADTAAPYTPKTPHRLCSAAKSILMLNALSAMEEGKMSPETKICELFTEISAVNENMKIMTMDDLFTMRTGQEKDPFFSLFSDMDADLIEQFLHTPPEEIPGKTFRYNNTVPHMIYAAVERAVGQQIEDYQNEHFCKPLDAVILAPTNNKGQYNPVVTSVSIEDFTKFAMLFLREGNWFGNQLLSADSIRKASKLHTETGLEGNAAGYAWQIWGNAFGGYRMDGGWGQYAVILPEMDLAVILQSDMTDSTYALTAIEEFLLPGLFEPVGQESAPILFPSMAPTADDNQLEGCIDGEYLLEDGTHITLHMEEKELVIRHKTDIDMKTYRVGFLNTWPESSSHLFATPIWNIDTGVYGPDLDLFRLSGVWKDCETLEIVGKSFGEMGEYRYQFQVIGDELTILYTPNMCHGISTLEHATKMAGRRQY